MHIFKYSIRKGTKAEKMENQVLPEIKEKRSKILLELSDKNEIDYLNSYIGKNIKVLIEEKDENGFYKGHTSNYIMAKMKSEKNIINNIVELNVKGQNGFILEGKIK